MISFLQILKIFFFRFFTGLKKELVKKEYIEGFTSINNLFSVPSKLDSKYKNTEVAAQSKNFTHLPNVLLGKINAILNLAGSTPTCN